MGAHLLRGVTDLSHRVTRREVIGALATIAIGGAASPAASKPRGDQGTGATTWTSLPPTPSLPGPPEPGCIDLRGACIFHRRFGAVDSPPVLLLHGGLGNANYWGHQVEHLAQRFSVHVMDTRGHGRSPVTSREFSYEAFARDVVALLDKLEIRQVAVVGWSDGAVTGLQLAMSHPERVSRLFAFGANSAPDGMIPNGARSPTFKAYGSRCRSEYATLSPKPERWPQLVTGLRAMWGREPNFSPRQLAAIKLPTTVADGEHDEIIRADHTKRMAAAIPGAKLRMLPGVSHFAMLQDPQQFNAELDTFLADLLPPK